MKNRHAIEIPPHVMDEVKKRLLEINELMSPFFIPLTPEERKRMAKISEKSIAFVSKAYELAHGNPNVCPKFLNMEDFRIDLEDATQLIAVKTTLKQIYEGVVDTETIAGSEAYQAALVFYNEVKIAAKQDVYGAKAIYEELKKRFPNRKKLKDIDPDADVK
jgi:hypothetical protein